MGSDIQIIGDDPARDGMAVSLRLRYDFTITDAERLMAAARRAFLDMEPDATPHDAETFITCAADAIFALLERHGLLGDITNTSIEACEPDGLEFMNGRAQLVLDEPEPMRKGPNCFRGGDVFALPASARHDAD